MDNFIGHDKGPGIAANVILLKLLDLLVKNKVITRGDINVMLATADAQIAAWGSNTAGADARRVINKMRGLGA